MGKVTGKKRGLQLNMRSFVGKSGTSYLIFRTKEGAFHVFQEVEAKEAARDCGTKVEGQTRQMWQDVWKRAV